MKKEYIIEEENNFNGGESFSNLEDAKRDLIKILDNLSNYQYVCNKNKVFTLSSIEYENDEEIWNTLISISIKEWKEMDYEEKEKIISDINE